MDILAVFLIGFYLISTAGYVAYLFLQKDYLQRIGHTMLIGGFLCHTLAIGYGFMTIGHIPAANLYQTLLIAGWAVAGTFIAFQYKYNVKILGVYTAPMLLLSVIFATLLPNKSVQAQQLFNNFWLIFHIVSIFIGEAIFALACGIGVLYLLQERAIKTKKPGFFYRRLPSLELLDASGYACIISGFMMLTIGFITGMVYAKALWGRFWGWDPKEIWSAISWFLYAVLLHQRLVIGLRGRKAAILAIVGFGVLLFTFFGVNFLLEGHHGIFTR